MVNLASLGVGYIALPLIRQVGNQFTTSGLLLHWIFVFAITVVVEGFLLILLTKKKPREKVWLATVVMNLVSYAILILLFKDYGLGY
jgi:predicted MFS family arabinose efflux permease